MRIRWLLAATAILAVAVAAYLVYEQHAKVSSRPDSAAVIRAEEKDSLRDARAAFAADSVSGFYWLPLPRPLSVRIAGKNATLNVAGKMPTNNFVYAQAWYEIYRKYHGDGTYTVCMRIVGKSGPKATNSATPQPGYSRDFYQTFPIDEVGWFPVKCPIP
jgi:hypothetical protein